MHSTLWMEPPPVEILWRCWTSLATTTSKRQCMALRSPAPSGIPTGRSSGSSGWSMRTSAKVGAYPWQGYSWPPHGSGVCFWHSKEGAQPVTGLRPTSWSHTLLSHPLKPAKGFPWIAAGTGPGQKERSIPTAPGR